MSENLLEKCVLDLFDVGVVKFGNFTLKSGIQSPIYIDLRIIISYPRIMEQIAVQMWDASIEECDYICGVPYTALPMATIISSNEDMPMVLRRKEAKTYGTKKLIEGEFDEGGKCLIIEDVIVSGCSIYETAQALQSVKLEVSEAVVFVDREQGGKKNLKELGIKVSSVLTISEMLRILQRCNKIDEVTFKNSLNFIKSHKNINIPLTQNIPNQISNYNIPRQSMSLVERLQLENIHPVAKRLLNIIKDKETNLCVAVDVENSAELLRLADDLGPYVCMLKTHINILGDFKWEVVEKLKDLALKHNFLIFEDSKFGDIGNTVRSQFTGGIFGISQWADLVTVHGVPGKGVVEGLQVAGAHCKGGVIVAQMSSEGALTSKEYVDGCMSLCESFSSFLFGYVGQSNLSDDPSVVQMTPGVSISDSGDKLGQKYKSPEEAIKINGADVIIVGRSIVRADNPKDMALVYRTKGMEALQQRIKFKWESRSS